MKDEVVRLRVSKALLRPIHLQNRTDEGSIEDRLDRAAKDLLQRQQTLESERVRIAAEVLRNWDREAIFRAPAHRFLMPLPSGSGSDFVRTIVIVLD